MDSTRAKLADAALIATGGVSGALSKLFTDHNFWSTFVLILTALLLVHRLADWWLKRLGLLWWDEEWKKRRKIKFDESGAKGAGHGEGDEE